VSTCAELPLQPSRVWSIRTKLQMQVRQRDLAVFHEHNGKIRTISIAGGNGLAKAGT
jgi:hypothetical protein